MSLNEIKNDMKKQELDENKKYNLDTGTHILLIDLNSKEKVVIDWDNKKLYYHKFNLVNNDKRYVMFSNFLYAEFLKALKPVVDKLKDDSIVECIVEVNKKENKTDYNIKINVNGDGK
jgi:predicted restriction endonuclease